MIFKGARFDVKRYECTWDQKDQKTGEIMEHTASLVGLPPDTVTRLALEGFMRRVAKSQNPALAVKLIETGQLDGPETKNYPRIVKAIAHIEDRPPREIYKIWRKLSLEEKQVYKKDPRVKQLFLEWSGAEQADMSIFKNEEEAA